MDSFLLGLLMGGVLKVYEYNINKKRHVINRDKVKMLSKLNIQNIPYINVREKYEEQIQNFINVIKKELPFIDLTNFDRNIKELKINEIKLSNNVLGQFNIKKIIIYLSQNDKYGSITHELFHLASSLYSGGIEFSGFYQKHNDFRIGIGLNEAYTQVLDDRYFAVNEHSYPMLKPAVRAIEKIIGREEMTKMYFEADLYGLIKSLSNYCTENEIYIMLKDMDEIDKYQDELKDRELSEFEKNDLQFKLYRITKLLYRCYINMLEDRLSKNIITTSEYDKLMSDFTTNLSVSFKVNNITFDMLNQELYNEIMNEHFNIADIFNTNKKR